MKDLDDMTLDELLAAARKRGLVSEYEFGEDVVRLQHGGESLTLTYPYAATFLRGLIFSDGQNDHDGEDHA